MSSAVERERRVYLMNSVVLTIEGVILDGGVARVGSTLGNRLLGGDGVEVEMGAESVGVGVGEIDFGEVNPGRFERFLRVSSSSKIP